MNWSSSSTSAEPVILHPRPLERQSGGILLLPLLPYPVPLKPLPEEAWFRIFSFVYNDDEDVESSVATREEPLRRKLLTVCKSLHAIAIRVFYSRVWITTVWALEKFTCRLHSAEQKWDSICRIPYSAPGRWVQSLDLSAVDCTSETMTVDELLTRLFPLVPFMSRFVLNTSIVLSRRALGALTFRDGTQHLRTLKGIKAPAELTRDWYGAVLGMDSDPLVQLVRNCVHLEELEIIGPGFDPTDIDSISQSIGIPFDGGPLSKTPLRLDRLQSLSILLTHSSPLMFALLITNLPSLQRLNVTPYDDIPYPASLVSHFIQVHGQTLRSLYFLTPRDLWPTTSHPSPRDVLIHCPTLNHLLLEFPLPKLSLPPRNHSFAQQQYYHPLQTLSIPRPRSEYLTVIEAILPFLKDLRIVRARDVRWLRKGMTPRALEAGVQGEMREWSWRLGTKGITFLDADNRELTNH